MSRSAHIEAQIIAAVKQVESGRNVEEVAREVVVSKHTIYAWKQKFGGLEVAEAQELGHLREENAAEEAGGRVSAGQRSAEVGDCKKRLQLVGAKAQLRMARADVEHLRTRFSMSERHACGLVSIAVSSCRYQSRLPARDTGLHERLKELALQHPRYGYRRLWVLVRRKGTIANHKRIHRLYREAGLSLRRIRRRRLLRLKPAWPAATACNQEWPWILPRMCWPVSVTCAS